ncbi:MAG: C_GCAxxG_C_C family protein [Solobacterium sp.]|nr:C_GCAxxG_C_C family protein [Solobacterium sp.]
MSEQNRSERAVILKHSGYNCAQSVLCAFAEESGLDEETLKKLGAAFCAGMGAMNATCGALCAAEMLLGLIRYEGKPVLKDAAAIHAEFTSRCGASICRDLKGIDTGTMICSCDDCVRNAAAIVSETLL